MEISLYHNQRITISVEELNEIKAKNRVLSRDLQKSINDYVDLLAVLKKERESNSDKAKKWDAFSNSPLYGAIGCLINDCQNAQMNFSYLLQYIQECVADNDEVPVYMEEIQAATYRYLEILSGINKEYNTLKDLF